MKEQCETDSGREQAGLRRRVARAWFSGAVAFLAAGVLAGAAIPASSFAWGFPVAGFLGYVLAFRRALSAGRPESLDDLWRFPSATNAESAVRRRGGWSPGWNDDQRRNVTRWDFRNGPPSGQRRPSDAADSREQK